MSLSELLKMSDLQLRQEYAKAKRQNNLEYIILINTIRIRKIMISAIEIFAQEDGKEKIQYFENKGIEYLYPKPTVYEPSLKGHIEFLILSHISSQTPVPVNIDLLKSLMPKDCIIFEKSEKEIDKISENLNIMNYNYMTEDVQQVKLPDIWVPNGEEELEIAVADMPKKDTDSVLLTNLTSYFIIDSYMISQPFTDVFYSPNDGGEIPKAIILNEIAGIKGNELEEKLQEQSITYKKQTASSSYENQNLDKMMIDLDLSTIWTAKYKEIIEDAITDSLENQNFVPTIAKIHKISSQIIVRLPHNNQMLGLDVAYNTVIIFDGKLILYESYQDENRKEITELFTKYGIPSMLTEEPINLAQFLKIDKQIGNEILEKRMK